MNIYQKHAGNNNGYLSKKLYSMRHHFKLWEEDNCPTVAFSDIEACPYMEMDLTEYVMEQVENALEELKCNCGQNEDFLEIATETAKIKLWTYSLNQYIYHYLWTQLDEAMKTFIEHHGSEYGYNELVKLQSNISNSWNKSIESWTIVQLLTGEIGGI